MTIKKGIYTVLSALVVAGSFLLYYVTYLHDAERIEPPFSVQIPYDTLSFRAEEGMNHHHFTGTNLKIPAKAFVDEDGFPVRGNVSVLYREFHSPEEILLSGIPMGNMEDEKNPALQSAGMFEMKAFQNGSELELGSGKIINVELAAFRLSSDYKIFQLDESSRWVETGTPIAMENELKQKGLAAIPDLPGKPEGPVIIDIDADYRDYPDIAMFRKYQWALADVPENNSFLQNQWAFRVNWDRMKVENFDKQKNLYKLSANVSMRDYDNKIISKKFSVIVSPLLTGEDYDRALADFNQTMNEYHALAEQIKKEEERLALEADLLNAFSINLMGVWNCDRFINNRQFVKIKASFDFAAHFNPYSNRVKVYVINHTDNTVQDYMVRDWDKIYLRSGSQTSIMAVLPDNKIAVFPQEKFVSVDFNKIYNGSREYFFNTSVYSADISGAAALKNML